MITIKRMGELRKELDVNQLILISVKEDGTVNVATHGKSKQDAKTAAGNGNKLKEYLGFPEEMCNTEPQPRECYYCDYFEKPPNAFGKNPGNCCFTVPKKNVYSDRKACGEFVSKF